MAARVTTQTGFAYEIADEVVVELDGVDAFELASGHHVERLRLPQWTIADVTAREVRDGRCVYAIRFRHADALCIALVDEASIDGTA